MPVAPPLPAWHGASPAARMPPAEADGLARALPPAAAGPAPPRMPAAATGFQELRLNQHLDDGQGAYRHLDVTIRGLVSGAGLWRQARLKLFERHGVAGLEFRQARGWPAMFDVWPRGGSDPYGPFWRLDAQAAPPALAALATPHDRALIAALVEVLPEIAVQASRAARLDAAQAEPWIGIARRLADAVAAARAADSPA
jgi:hypothetical protein